MRKKHVFIMSASLGLNCAECPLLSSSAGINEDKLPRCPFALRRIKKMSVGPRPNKPECPFVRELFFENGHSGGEGGYYSFIMINHSTIIQSGQAPF